MRPARKLVLCVVDSLRTDMLERAVLGGKAPNFGAVLERGELIGDCVSSFPSVTPVCSSEIVTGERGDRHHIGGMNWYHRAEERYVEYGSSLEATRAFGLFRTLYDIVYNMNMSHLSPEVETIFERLGDRGVRTACTPFLIYRGRTRHELGLEGMLRRVAVAASFRHATWGPDELFYGELYASRRVPCKPTLARPGTRDPYSACVGRELVAEDLYDFLLYSLPDNDYHSHRFGPEAQLESIARADESFGELAQAVGGLDSFLDEHSVILLADHAQSRVEWSLPLADALAEEWRVLEPTSARPEQAELAVSPSARSAGVYVLLDADRHRRAHDKVRQCIRGLEGVDVLSWLADSNGDPVRRHRGSTGFADEVAEAVVVRDGRELRFRPGAQVDDRRAARWDVDGDLGALAAEAREGRLHSELYPDPLGRLWSALTAPHGPDMAVSAAPGYELVDWGGATHCPGGSHGSLHACDSLGPLALCGFEPGTQAVREQWSLADVAGLVLDHFGVSDPGAGVELSRAPRRRR
ncbi:MAG TPA: alkaline phosphatase family protein [Solirubrobacterales bacterium]|jgi:Type I phosphodiesterase / nucleotide pyrophosphatase|nr:alkaline phosphatase family protein [Solirubrobacterales bacterium]